MAFYRDYVPVFSCSNKEFTQKMIDSLAKSNNKLHIIVNEAPYNRYGDHPNPIETEHYTMFYTENTDKHWIRHHIKEHKKQGYAFQEVPDLLKSVHLPHIHFVRKKN